VGLVDGSVRTGRNAGLASGLATPPQGFLQLASFGIVTDALQIGDVLLQLGVDLLVGAVLAL
jgi:hypothetical protein